LRRAASVDTNQPSMVDWARKLGFTVTVTSRLGQGFPDICLGKFGFTFLAEIKDPAKPPSKRKLTADEQKWHDSWLGHVCILETSDDLVALHDYAKRLRMETEAVA
jgi:hypothetical protein